VIKLPNSSMKWIESVVFPDLGMRLSISSFWQLNRALNNFFGSSCRSSFDTKKCDFDLLMTGSSCVVFNGVMSTPSGCQISSYRLSAIKTR